MPDPAALATGPGFDREKWEADVRLRERELELKAEELRLKNREQRWARWFNPLAIAIAAAALAGYWNARVAEINGEAQQRLEEGKAEAARILEVVKTNNPDRAATNLTFLLDAGLIANAATRKSLAQYLASRPIGSGVALPATARGTEDDPAFYGYPPGVPVRRDASGRILLYNPFRDTAPPNAPP